MTEKGIEPSGSHGSALSNDNDHLNSDNPRAPNHSSRSNSSSSWKRYLACIAITSYASFRLGSLLSLWCWGGMVVSEVLCFWQCRRGFWFCSFHLFDGWIGWWIVLPSSEREKGEKKKIYKSEQWLVSRDLDFYWTLVWTSYSLFGLLITTLLLLCSNKDHDDGAMHGAIRFSWISPL